MGADILLTPELVLTGYPPEDLLLRPQFVCEQQQQLEELRRELAGFKGLHVVVSHVDGDTCGAKAYAFADRNGRHVLYNAASVLFEGRLLGTYHKRELPTYSVFDEQRYFTAGGRPFTFEVKGTRFGVAICEDIWFEHAPKAAREAGSQVLLVPNASPYNTGKQAQRLEVIAECARLSGGPGHLREPGRRPGRAGIRRRVFRGRRPRPPCARLPEFQACVHAVDIGPDGAITPAGPQADMQPTETEEQVWQALVLGVRDYLGKNRFPGAIIGLSGGIDSAVVLAIAVDALGAENVRAVMMPSRYTADISQTDAADMARSGWACATT